MRGLLNFLTLLRALYLQCNAVAMVPFVLLVCAADVGYANNSTRSNGANTFFHNPENHLTNATVGGTSVSYTYNADGVHIGKTSGGQPGGADHR